MMFDRVINATGRNINVETIQDEFVEQLLSRDLLEPHPLGGFQVDARTSHAGGLYVIGPLTRGVRFYTYVLSQNARQITEAVQHLRDSQHM